MEIIIIELCVCVCITVTVEASGEDVLAILGQEEGGGYINVHGTDGPRIY